VSQKNFGQGRGIVIPVKIIPLIWFDHHTKCGYCFWYCVHTCRRSHGEAGSWSPTS